MPELRNKFAIPDRWSGSPEQNIWVTADQLVAEYNPLNLSIGASNYLAPDHFRHQLELVASQSLVAMQQYTRSYGHPRLVRALANMYGPLVGRQINPETELLVSGGAFEALFVAVQSHIDVGDEVIVIEPIFDCYEPAIKSAGGVIRSIPLQPPTNTGANTTTTTDAGDWQLDWTRFAALFNGRTKMLILNTPNNPLGKMYSRAELERMAALCRRWNVLCLCDEVYEWMTHGEAEHVRMASLPGMWQRTLTVCSAGKTFSLTGWRIGWVYGAEELVRNLHVVHQNSVYVVCTPVQEAVAAILEQETVAQRTAPAKSYLNGLPEMLRRKRDYLVGALRAAGLQVIVPQGGIFILADWSGLRPDLSEDGDAEEAEDAKFTRWLARCWGLLGIPPTAFFRAENQHLARRFVRLCFVKDDETLRKAAEIFGRIAAGQGAKAVKQ